MRYVSPALVRGSDPRAGNGYYALVKVVVDVRSNTFPKGNKSLKYACPGIPIIAVELSRVNREYYAYFFFFLIGANNKYARVPVKYDFISVAPKCV